MGALVKFVLVALVVALLVWWLAGGARRLRRDRPPRELPPPEGMLRCAHCGVHLPQSEALRERGRAYCSAAHRDAGPRDTPS
jgi:uncharacterized protein